MHSYTVMKLKFVLIILFFTILRGVSQNYTHSIHNLPKNKWTKLSLSPFTSFVVEQTNDEWVKSWVIADQDTIELRKDVHTSNQFSQQVFSFSYQEIWIKSEKQQQVKVHLYFVKNDILKKKPKIKSSSNCTLPTIITPSEWRNDSTVLIPPKVKPVATTVQHVIIHHAATSNLYTNYYGTIQNIYLHHTQTNGWDDIGYNYLIAPDGTIFQGRDAQNIDSPDNIRGAHMCNKNNYTMAICLLGTYTNVDPTQEMLNSLEHLITWKLTKESIDPLGESLHAIGPTSAGLPNDFLPHIAGHRDGCKSGYTECPGQKVYDLLPKIRQNVNQYKSTCIASIADQEVKKNHQFDNHILSFEEEKDCILVYDISGQLIEKRMSQQKINVDSFQRGVYFVKVIQNYKVQLIKIVKI